MKNIYTKLTNDIDKRINDYSKYLDIDKYALINFFLATGMIFFEQSKDTNKLKKFHKDILDIKLKSISEVSK